jgi:hypothetical protein
MVKDMRRRIKIIQLKNLDPKKVRRVSKRSMSLSKRKIRVSQALLRKKLPRTSLLKSQPLNELGRIHHESYTRF